MQDSAKKITEQVQQHTPKLEIVDRGKYGIALRIGEGVKSWDAAMPDKETATLIVKAVNAHEELVEFIREFVYVCNAHPPLDLMNEIGSKCEKANHLLAKVRS